MRHGVGSSAETAALELIYETLLQEHGQNKYRYISIIQIGHDSDELVLKIRNTIYCKVKYPVYEDFDIKSESEKNLNRLEVIHTALLRIADHDRKLDKMKLEQIKAEILAKDFYFEIARPFVLKANDINMAVIIIPRMTSFDFYLSAKKDGTEICRVLVYKALPSLDCYNYFFKNGKWKNANEFVIWGSEKHLKTHFFLDTSNVVYEESPTSGAAPLFEMMRSDITKAKRDKIYEEWKQSLPPDQRAALDSTAY